MREGHGGKGYRAIVREEQEGGRVLRIKSDEEDDTFKESRL